MDVCDSRDVCFSCVLIGGEAQAHKSTVWAGASLPQNRCVFVLLRIKPLLYSHVWFLPALLRLLILIAVFVLPRTIVMSMPQGDFHDCGRQWHTQPLQIVGLWLFVVFIEREDFTSVTWPLIVCFLFYCLPSLTPAYVFCPAHTLINERSKLRMAKKRASLAKLRC